jgi:cytochrome oxidase Cu insertion factor (SCO1/SenC/PrrC family)
MASNGKRTIWLMAAISLLPLIAAILVYQLWRPQSGMNHGELLETRPLPPAVLSDLAGNTFTSDKLLGKWLLVTIQSPACDEKCQRKLYYLRQVRITQGENMGRIERLWLLRGEGLPDAQLVAAHPGLRIARPKEPAWLAEFPTKGDALEHIYLIDPMGNLVLRYDDDVNPKGMVSDLTRLLKISRVG